MGPLMLPPDDRTGFRSSTGGKGWGELDMCGWLRGECAEGSVGTKLLVKMLGGREATVATISRGQRRGEMRRVVL